MIAAQILATNVVVRGGHSSYIDHRESLETANSELVVSMLDACGDGVISA